jgi:hypothetical protein
MVQIYLSRTVPLREQVHLVMPETTSTPPPSPPLPLRRGGGGGGGGFESPFWMALLTYTHTEVNILKESAARELLYFYLATGTARWAVPELSALQIFLRKFDSLFCDESRVSGSEYLEAFCRCKNSQQALELLLPEPRNPISKRNIQF